MLILDLKAIAKNIRLSVSDRYVPNQIFTPNIKKINPIIQNYMDTNSIDILLERKNVFIGKNKSDITDIIINEIDNKFKN